MVEFTTAEHSSIFDKYSKSGVFQPLNDCMYDCPLHDRWIISTINFRIFAYIITNAKKCRLYFEGF